MENKIIEMNGKKITLMEQPTSIMIEWDKKYKGNVLGHIKQILKYPADANPKVTEIFDVPKEMKALNVVKEFENAEDYLKTCEKFIPLGGQSYVSLGNEFLKMANKDVDEYKYMDVRKIGEEIMEQIMFFLELASIVDTFRKI